MASSYPSFPFVIGCHRREFDHTLTPIPTSKAREATTTQEIQICLFWLVLVAHETVRISFQYGWRYDALTGLLLSLLPA